MIEYATFSTVETRQHFADFINRISVLKEWILISRRGKPIVGAVPLEDFEYFEGPEDSTDTQGMQTFEDIMAKKPKVELLGIAEDAIEYRVSTPDNRLHRVTTVEARKHFADLLNRVNYGKQRIILTRRGWDLLAIIPPEAFERYLLVDAIEDEIDSQLATEALREAEREGTIPWEEVKRELGLSEPSY